LYIMAVVPWSPVRVAMLMPQGYGAAGRAQNVLVTAQVSLALVLLVCAGLLVRSLQNLNAVDPGFNPAHLLTFEIAPQARFDSPVKRSVLFRRIAQNLAGTEGVESVGAINHIPINGDVWTYRYEIPGRSAPLPGHEYGAAYRVVLPGYFETMRMSFASGRALTEHDDEQAPPVVVINQTMARHQWPHEDPVGRQVVFPERGLPRVPLTVVGVVRDVRQSDWTGPADDEVYFPYAQRQAAFGSNTLTFVIRTKTAPETVAAHFRGGGMREGSGHRSGCAGFACPNHGTGDRRGALAIPRHHDAAFRVRPDCPCAGGGRHLQCDLLLRPPADT